MIKEEIIQAFLNQFQEELKALFESAQSAHQAATHEESKAEDRHDTFAIEASYLAAGQAARVAELEKTVVEFEGYLAGTPRSGQVGPGSVVVYESEGKIVKVFFSILGGGTRVEVRGQWVQALTIHSPLGEEFQGARAGDELTVEVRAGERQFRIQSID